MHQAGVGDGLESGAAIDHQFKCTPLAQLATGDGHQLAGAAAGDQFLHQVGPSLVLTDGDDRHHVGVADRGGGARFTQEAFAGLGGILGRRQHHLDCDLAIEIELQSAVDRAHPATAELRQDAAAADHLTCVEHLGIA